MFATSHVVWLSGTSPSSAQKPKLHNDGMMMMVKVWVSFRKPCFPPFPDFWVPTRPKGWVMWHTFFFFFSLSLSATTLQPFRTEISLASPNGNKCPKSFFPLSASVLLGNTLIPWIWPKQSSLFLFNHAWLIYTWYGDVRHVKIAHSVVPKIIHMHRANPKIKKISNSEKRFKVYVASPIVLSEIWLFKYHVKIVYTPNAQKIQHFRVQSECP